MFGQSAVWGVRPVELARIGISFILPGLIGLGVEIARDAEPLSGVLVFLATAAAMLVLGVVIFVPLVWQGKVRALRDLRVNPKAAILFWLVGVAVVVWLDLTRRSSHTSFGGLFLGMGLVMFASIVAERRREALR